MDAVIITHAEIIDALRTASEVPDGAVTVAELSATTGLNVKRIREALQRLMAERRLVVHKVARMGIDGRMSQVPAYTVTSPPRKRK